jgi:hypothetical protein
VGNLSPNILGLEQKIRKICIMFQDERSEIEKMDYKEWQMIKYFH